MKLLEQIAAEVIECRSCPRLVSWREEVAQTRRAAYANDTYWGLPVPGFGDPSAPILVVGLAPGAHGANRTGRMFTGDRSGDWLYRAMFDAGLANQPESIDRGDGLTLRGAYVTAVVRCAPPDNKPTTGERDACIGYLQRELNALPARTIVCLGAFAWKGVIRALEANGHDIPRPRPVFSHGARTNVSEYNLLGSYHPSQQNTFTKRLTESMLREVFLDALEAAEGIG